MVVTAGVCAAKLPLVVNSGLKSGGGTAKVLLLDLVCAVDHLEE
jgi:hypothetical protein